MMRRVLTDRRATVGGNLEHELIKSVRPAANCWKGRRPDPWCCNEPSRSPLVWVKAAPPVVAQCPHGQA
jgi:hypothetical protein